MSEIEWRKISGFPNYSVSSLGQIRNDKTGRILKPSMSMRYPAVTIPDANGVIRGVRVHLAVSEAFLNHSQFPELEPDHLDGNKHNFKLSNLELVTHKENIDRAVRSGQIKSRRIRHIDTGVVYRDAKTCAEALGIPRHSVYNVVRGLVTHYKGLHFEYA